MPIVTERDESAELLGLISRFESLLERSDLAELEVQVAGTLVRLAKPAPAAQVDPAGGAAVPVSPAMGQGPAIAPEEAVPSGLVAVTAPLTGVFYLSPSPDAAPYVRAGGTVNSGQVIGLIEAMKLFNEIKSDVTGTVVRIAVESGALVKQKQTLVEVRPS